MMEFCFVLFFVFWWLRYAYDESIFGGQLSAALKSQGQVVVFPPGQPTHSANLACVEKREQPQQTDIMKPEAV